MVNHSQRLRALLPDFFPPLEVIASVVEVDPEAGPTNEAAEHYERNMRLLENEDFRSMLATAERQARINLTTLGNGVSKRQLRLYLTTYQAIANIAKDLVMQMEAYEKAVEAHQERIRLMEEGARERKK